MLFARAAPNKTSPAAPAVVFYSWGGRGWTQVSACRTTTRPTSSTLLGQLLIAVVLPDAAELQPRPRGQGRCR